MRRLRTASLVAAMGTLAAGCGSGSGPTTSVASAPTRTATAAPAAAGCRSVARPQPRQVSLDRPTDALDPKRRYTVTLTTSCGDIAFLLASGRQPRTAASFASLVRKGVLDGTIFGRIGKDPSGGDFVIQGGDPTLTGSGGPGYSITEKPPAGAKYVRGTVAMAKTEIERPGTSGSQFFIVTAPDAGLPVDYAVLGRVTGGEDTVRRIAAVASDPQTEAPLSPVVIEKATVLSAAGAP